MTGDRRWFSSLTPVMTKEYITFGDNGKGRELSVGMVKVGESVTFSVFLLSSLWVTVFLMRVLKFVSKRVVLVSWTLKAISCARLSPRVRFSEPIFSVCWLFSLLGCWCFGGALEMA
jgi:hypothetical protein